MSKECSWPGCAKKVPAERWGCGEHFRILPDEIRMAIMDGAPHAASDAEQWIRATFGGEIKGRWDPGKWERLCTFVRDRDRLRKLRQATP